MAGFYRMSRGWLEHRVFNGHAFDQRSAWVWLIENAAFKERTYDIAGKQVPCQRGQLVASIRFLASAWGWKKSAVHRFLAKLKAENMIGTATETVTGTGCSVISITNYATYQASADDGGTDGGTGEKTQPGQNRIRKKEGKKEGGAKAPADYAFNGQIIHLTRQHYENWQQAYSRLDLRAALQNRDDWLAKLSPDDRRRQEWFTPTSNWLAKLNREAGNGSGAQILDGRSF